MGSIRAYLLGVATAGALATGAIGIESLNAQTTKPSVDAVSTAGRISTDSAFIQNLKSQAGGYLCESVEQQGGYAAGDCTPDHLIDLCFHFEPDSDWIDGEGNPRHVDGTRYQAGFQFPGSFVLGAPQ